jgi:hypothetical protein
MTASAPSKTAMEMSDTSARVGTGAVIMDLRDHDHQLAIAAHADHALPQARHGFERQFDAGAAEIVGQAPGDGGTAGGQFVPAKADLIA